MIGDETAALINGTSTPPSSSKNVGQDAESIKEQANRHFKEGHYDKAIELYSKAIELNQSSAA